MNSALRTWRKDKRLTQEALAGLVGVSSSRISLAENGISCLGDKLESFLYVCDGAHHIIVAHPRFLEWKRKELMKELHRPDE